MSTFLGSFRALARPFVLGLALLPVVQDVAWAAGDDLAKVYGGTLDHEEGVGAVDWEVGPGDVWQLKGFEYKLRGKFEIKLDKATVVVGRSTTEETGNSAVWAAVFPEEPAEITSSESGHGDHATAIYMRFHPSLIGELFPKKMVKGQGDPSWLVWAKRQYGHKINAGWQSGSMPVVPTKDSLVFDMDTLEGKRRYYVVDTNKKKLTYVADFAGRTVAPIEADGLKPKEAKKIFETVWQAFDKEYAMFGVKPNVDWKKLKKTYGKLANKAQSSYELAGVIGLLISELQDLHAYVKVGNQYIHTYNRFRVTNANWRAVKGSLQDLQESKGLAYGRTEDNRGYITVWNLSTEGLSDSFDEALEKLSDTTGMIVDLRFNGGGDETMARRMAGRFLAKEAVYSKNQYRNGSKHKNLGQVLDRSFEPRGPWRYTAPVILLQGQRTMSSAESMALMFAQCEEVTTLGDRTAGSSANPRRLELPRGIVVNLPRWLDMDTKGKPIDRVGIAPDVVSEANQPKDFKNGDPVFDEALELLAKSKNTKPGKL